MGHPHYEVTQGDVFINGESLLSLPPDERAKRGLFGDAVSVSVPG